MIPTQGDGSQTSKLRVATGGLLRFSLLAARRRLDLVHLHVSTGPSLVRKVYAVAVARVCRVPLVLHLHSGGFKALTQEGGRSGWLSRRALRWVVRRSDMVVVLSQSWADDLSAWERPRQLCVVPNAPEPISGVDRSVAEGSGSPVILYLGHLYRDKGVYDLLEAFRLVLDRHPAARLVLAGEGREEEGLRLRMSDLGLEQSVELTGWVGPEGRRELLSAAACLTLPSYGEGLPLVVLEAMQVGVPVVATPVGGVPEVVRDDVEALLVAPGEPAALAAALSRVIADRALVARLVEAARQRVEAEYSRPALIRRVEALYRHMLTGARQLEANAGRDPARPRGGDLTSQVPEKHASRV